jgi:hypothetical protein
VLDQAFHAAEADGEPDQPHAVHERLGLIERAAQLHGDHPAECAHLLGRDRMPVRFEPG